DSNGVRVASAAGVRPGDGFQVMFPDGTVKGTVTSVEPVPDGMSPQEPSRSARPHRSLRSGSPS
ncbi:MAG: hypothetical protein IJ840_01965, partial [Bacteroidales bacterium]|nr:hypothetical protein [Bacteroidales bacterium]